MRLLPRPRDYYCYRYDWHNWRFTSWRGDLGNKWDRIQPAPDATAECKHCKLKINLVQVNK